MKELNKKKTGKHYERGGEKLIETEKNCLEFHFPKHIEIVKSLSSRAQMLLLFYLLDINSTHLSIIS